MFSIFYQAQHEQEAHGMQNLHLITCRVYEDIRRLYKSLAPDDYVHSQILSNANLFKYVSTMNLFEIRNFCCLNELRNVSRPQIKAFSLMTPQKSLHFYFELILETSSTD